MVYFNFIISILLKDHFIIKQANNAKIVQQNAFYVKMINLV